MSERIQFEWKEQGQNRPDIIEEKKFTYDNANEIKQVVNEHADEIEVAISQIDGLATGILSADFDTDPSDNPSISSYFLQDDFGTYTDFLTAPLTPLTVTEGEWEDSLWLAYKPAGATYWQKRALPIGSAIKNVTFTSTVLFDLPAKKTTIVQSGDIAFTYDDSGSQNDAYYAVDIETNGDDISFSSDFDLMGEIDTAKNVSIIFHKLPINSKIQAIAISTEKGTPALPLYRIGGFDLDGQKARSFVEWIRFNLSPMVSGSFAYNVGKFISGIEYNLGNISTNPADPAGSQYDYWDFDASLVTTGGEYTTADGSLTVKLGYALPTELVGLGNHTYDLEEIVIPSSPKYRIGGYNANAIQARTWFEWVRINDDILPYGAFAYNVGLYEVSPGTYMYLGNISTDPLNPSGSQIFFWDILAAGVVAGGEYTSSDGRVTVKMGSVVPTVLHAFGDYNYPMELIIE